MAGASTDRGDRAGSAWRVAGSVTGWLVAAALGFVWPIVITVVAALVDGAPADDYDAGNRAAFTGLWLVTTMLCPVGALMGYAVGRALDWSVWWSLALSQAGAVLAATWPVALYAAAG